MYDLYCVLYARAAADGHPLIAITAQLFIRTDVTCAQETSTNNFDVFWVLVEPAVLSAYLLLTLLLKWCTDFSDLPEVRAEIVKQKSGVVNTVGRAKE